MLLPWFFAAVARAPAADEALLRRVAAGDSGALRQLYDGTASAALAVALRILRTRSEAEEVVQDAFVELWRRAQSYDPRRGTPVSFVLAIARSRAIDRLRARGASERVADASSREEAAPVPLPIESAEQRENRDRLQAALAGLPAEQRETLELAYFEGLSQAQIAEKTGQALGTVKTRCRLALAKLASVLAEVAP